MSEQLFGEIVLYSREEGVPAIEVRLDGETVWLTQQQLADLFQSSRTNVVEHIKHIYEEGELDEAATCRDFRQVRQEGNRQVERTIPHYNLDLIISLGYRVRSKVATRFRIWATERLREYLVKGFTMDDAKLKELGGGRYWIELLQRIRDIRSSEKVLYRQVLGLTSFAGERPRKSDVAVAKNYLNESELKKLNTLVSAYFDAAEFRAQSHESTHMRDWLVHLDRLIAAMDAPVLTSAGSVSHKQAIAKAEGEYEKYLRRPDLAPSDVERAYLDSMKRVQHQLEGKPER